MEDALTIVNNSIESINNLESINENMIRMSEMVRNGGGIENAEGGGWADDDDDDDDDFVEMEVANARGAAGHGGLWAGSSKRAAGGAAAGGRDQALSTRPSRPGAAPGERVYSELELKKLKKREYNAAYYEKNKARIATFYRKNKARIAAYYQKEGETNQREYNAAY